MSEAKSLGDIMRASDRKKKQDTKPRKSQHCQWCGKGYYREHACKLGPEHKLAIARLAHNYGKEWKVAFRRHYDIQDWSDQLISARQIVGYAGIGYIKIDTYLKYPIDTEKPAV